MAIRIITDSTSDIPSERQEELGIEIVPLSVRFGNEEYLDGVTLTKPQFFQKLAECEELPTTAQVNPERFAKIFGKYGAEDDIIGIFISGKMSGTFQSAGIAKNLLGAKNITLIDSSSVTFGLGLLVLEAVRMRDAGRSAQEISKAISALCSRLRLFAIIDTLKYLKMGGRLSASSALFGTMLHIKPIISIIDGEVVAMEKRKGLRSAVECVAQKVMQEEPDQAYQIVFGDSNAPELTNMLKETLANEAGLAGGASFELGTVVGTHAGPGCAGIAYIAKANE